MCHESSGRAMTRMFGHGKGTVLLEDFKKAELVFRRRTKSWHEPSPAIGRAAAIQASRCQNYHGQSAAGGRD